MAMMWVTSLLGPDRSDGSVVVVVLDEVVAEDVGDSDIKPDGLEILSVLRRREEINYATR